jgi:uncharacterized protein YfaS (alpha-2-macroglobulin family)
MQGLQVQTIRSCRHWAGWFLAYVGLALAIGLRTAPADTPTQPFALSHVLMQPNAASPTVCLRFDEALSAVPTIHYGDYLSLVPAARPSITVTGSELCLGGLDYATTFKLTLRQGLPAASGAKLATAQTLDLAMADRAALVAISGNGYILSRNTANGLVIQTVNVTKVKIHLLRMSDKLLPTQLQGDIALNQQTTNPWEVNRWLQNTASVVWSGTMDVPEDHNRTVSTAFPIASVVPPGRNGLYLVVAEDAAHAQPEAMYTSSNFQPADDDFDVSLAAHWVVATDITLTSMDGSDGLHVFARSLATARPLPGVKIRLIATGQDILGVQTTDASGAVSFPAALLVGSRANAPATLVAYGDGRNFAFQDFTRPAFDLSDRGVSGRISPGDFQAFLYTERGIYRPGETVTLVTLLRNRVGIAVTGQPLKLILRRPDGVADRSFVLPEAAAGGFVQPIKLSASAARGNWTLEAYVNPAAPPIGQVQIDVEDFVPQQLKVSLTATRSWLSPSQPLTASLDGSFLYGAPAAGLHAQGDLAVTRDTTPVPDAGGYQFGLVDDKVTDIDSQLTLDDADGKGHLALSQPLPSLPQTSVPLRAVLTAGLFEPSGRYVSSTITLPIRTQPVLLGIKPQFAGGQVQDGDPALFDLKAFADSGKPVATAGLHWTLVQEEPVFDWFQDNGPGWTWHFHTEDTQLATGALDIGAGGKLNFAPSGLGQDDWGTYRLILSDPASGAASSVRFNIGWNTAGGSASTPDKAEVAVDKPFATPGRIVHLHIRGPFAGKAQIVIANDRIFSVRTLDVPKIGITVPITVGADWGAGAYAVVTLYRPLADQGPFSPVRAMGLAWIGIDPAAHRLNVAVLAPAKITPRQTLNVTVKIAGLAQGSAAFVTLAAVDEGILQITRFTTPDPLDYFYGKLALTEDIRDDYGNLLDGGADPGAIHQGGDAGDLGGPGLPVTSTKIVSLFSGRVRVGGDGMAHVAVQVPDFEGRLRLMAVAYDATQLGSADTAMIVRDPVIVDVALPRFLAPGDAAQSAISLQNTDGIAGAYHLAMTATGPVSLTLPHPLEYQLGRGQRLQDAMTITAKTIGIARINAVLTGPGGYRVARSWQIAIRSPHYPLVEQSVAEQPAGSSYTPDPALPARFLPGSVAVSIAYAGFPGIDVPSLLQSLWLYPFGCTEQMASTAFPLLYYHQAALLGSVGDQDNDFTDTSDAGVHARVQQAVDTLRDRENDDGVFGLWQIGDNQASPWLNVYALDFMIHAKAAGYDVPDDAISRGYLNLGNIVAKIESGQGNANNGGVDAINAPSTEAYAEYLLTQAGQGDIGILRRLHDAATLTADTDGAKIRRVYWADNPSDENTLVPPLAMAQVSAGLALLGDQNGAASAMQLAVANIGVTDYPNWWFDGEYYTDARDIAGMIAIAAQQDNISLAGALLQKLNGLKLQPADLSTQDKAWLLAAAAKLNGQQAKNANLTVNGKPQTKLMLPLAFSPGAAMLAAGYGIRNDGPHALWRTVTLTGVPATPPPAIANGFTLTTRYYQLDGKQLDPSHLRQNDRFIVALTGRASDDEDHRAVLVDMLPAGWEIETPIRDDSTQDSFLGALSTPRVMEARDDRFVAAFDLGGNWDPFFVQDDDSNDNDNTPTLESDQFAVAFLVRVVTPGRFILPEAVVSDMYRPAETARTAAAATIVDPR